MGIDSCDGQQDRNFASANVKIYQSLLICVFGLELFCSAYMVAYGVYQMETDDLVDKVLLSLDVIYTSEARFRLPVVLTICEQLILGVGVTSIFVTIITGAFGLYMKKRAYMTAGAVILFILASITLSVGVSLILSLHEFYSVSVVPDPAAYGVDNSTTLVLDDIQAKFSCCGRWSSADYLVSPCFQPMNGQSKACFRNITGSSVVPASCCAHSSLLNCSSGNTSETPSLHPVGCQTMLHNALVYKMKLISASLIAFTSFIAMCLPLTLCLHTAVSLEKRKLARSCDAVEEKRSARRCYHTGTCYVKHCRHSFPVVAPRYPLHIKPLPLPSKISQEK